MDSLFLSGCLFLSAIGPPPLAVARFIGLGRGVCLGRIIRPNDDLGAVPELVSAVNDDAVAGRKTGKNFHAIAVGYTKLNYPNRYRAVGIDKVDEGARRAAL